MTVEPMHAWIALGSNLGDRASFIGQSLALLAETPGVRVISQSALHETEPMGGPPGQGRYLNAAAQLALDPAKGAPPEPHGLLSLLLAVEQQLGRTRSDAERNLPRTIDLDLLLAERIHARGDPTPIVVSDASLHLPHPRLHERAFVLQPLAEIAPTLRHPLQGLTIAELLARL